MSSKRRKGKKKKTVYKECTGCCYKIKSKKGYARHLKTHNCDQVVTCDKCEIFKTLNSDMYDEHRENCTGTKCTEAVEEEEEEEPPKKRKKKKKTK